MAQNFSLAMFLKCFLIVGQIEPHVSYTHVSYIKKNVYGLSITCRNSSNQKNYLSGENKPIPVDKKTSVKFVSYEWRKLPKLPPVLVQFCLWHLTKFYLSCAQDPWTSGKIHSSRSNVCNAAHFLFNKNIVINFRPFYLISDNFWTLDKICEILFYDNIVQNFIVKTVLFTESKNVKPFSSYEHFFEARCYIF